VEEERQNALEVAQEEEKETQESAKAQSRKAVSLRFLLNILYS
jgi:hypothetical protein